MADVDPGSLIFIRAACGVHHLSRDPSPRKPVIRGPRQADEGWEDRGSPEDSEVNQQAVTRRHFNSVVEAFTPSREELRLGAQSTNSLVRDVGCWQAGALNSQPKGNTYSTLDQTVSFLRIWN